MTDRESSSARRPTIFITHLNIDGYHIVRLADVFRKAQIEALTINADNDEPPGRLLTDSIIKHSSTFKILLIAISPGALESDWFQSALPNQILPSLEDYIDRIIVLDLVARPSRPALPAYLKSQPRVDLRDYAAGVTELLEQVGSESDTATSRTRSNHRKTDYFTVSGAFEVGRPSSEMFSELKRQLYDAPYKIDLKYLYWDVRAASRWQDITQMSRYLTTQTAVNVLTRHADDLAEQILAGQDRPDVTFINFGVGTGQKDFLILKALLDQPGDAGPAKVAYFPVDESLPMLQITIAALEDLMASYRDDLAIRFVLDDFQFIERFQRYVAREEEAIFGHRHRPPRLLAFMDTLGNFDERHILGLLREFMSSADTLLLGVELIGKRPDDALIANYSDDYMTAFLAGPITDVYGRTDPDPPAFKYRVVTRDKQYSVVPQAATVVGRITHRNQPIEMFYSTKYDAAALETFLEKHGFVIVGRVFSEHDPPRYANYLLQSATTDD
jgi:uncharacterized SAM-dependent methyltransferase